MEASFNLHSAFSFRNCCFTNAIVNIEYTAEKAQGSPHPTPKPMSTSNSMINTVETIAITISPRPQTQLNIIIIRLKRGLTSYLFNTAALYWTPPWPSIHPASSMKASNAGFQSSPFSVDDILKGNLLRICVRMAEPQKRNPK